MGGDACAEPADKSLRALRSTGPPTTRLGLQRKCYFGKGANVDFASAGKGVRAVFMIMAR